MRAGTGTRGLLTKGLAVAGTVLVWFPVLATVLTSIAGTIRHRMFRFDYLMPAELFFLVAAGGGLLLWAAWRARLRRGPIGWGLALAVGLLATLQISAVAVGLSTGRTEFAGWPRAMVLGLVALYSLAVLGLGVAGAVLVRDLSRGSST